MGQTLTYTVPESFDGRTVQQFLQRFCGLSYRMIVRLRHQPCGIEADGRQLWTIDTVKAGQRVLLHLPDDEVRIDGADLPLDILFEDEHILLVNKPAHIAVHPSAGLPDPTVANAVVAHYAAAGTPLAFRPTNRLDKGTSGILLIAKSAHTAFALTHKAKKTYLAVAQGELHGSGRIDRPIRRREGSIIAREVGEGGKESVTHWEALGTDGEVTLLRVVIDTGRTHQIRCHCGFLGHPLVGDMLYGDGSLSTLLDRQALHCAVLEVDHPITGEPLRFTAPLPADMAALLAERNIYVPDF